MPVFHRYTFFYALIVCLGVSWGAAASETDQFMVWGIEMEDGSAALNRFLNEEVEVFLAEVNAKPKLSRLPSEVIAQKYFSHVFKGLLSSKLRKWFRESGEIETYPPRETTSVYQYQERSVYRGRSFPYYLPMSRTVRLGEVYLGTDKVSHMFGFGRRSFKLYLECRAGGMTDIEAERRVIRWSIAQESTIVGKLVDGVMSYGDLEANYQGMQMLKDLCMGPNPFFIKEDGVWKHTRPLDVLPYITPNFDESYNTPHYWLLRKRFVLPIYREEICEKYRSPEVQARFAIYDRYEDSFFMQVMEEWLSEKRTNPKRNHSLEVICAECEPDASVAAD